MYRVTIDLAAPSSDAQIVMQGTDAVGAELERLVLHGAGRSQLKRLETVVTPAGAIVAATVTATSARAARTEVGELIDGALAAPRFAGWQVISADVDPEQ